MSSWWRLVRRASTCAPPCASCAARARGWATCGRSPCSRSRRRRSPPPRRDAGGRGLREQPGPDDRRRPARGARAGAGPLHRRPQPRQLRLRDRPRSRRRRAAGADRGGPRHEEGRRGPDRRSATDQPPTEPARLVDDFTPALIDVAEHHLCPGCGEPVAIRSVVEAIEELDVVQRTIAVFGIGCYTAFSNNLDVEVLQALHGRAPSLATGVKRASPAPSSSPCRATATW